MSWILATGTKATLHATTRTGGRALAALLACGLATATAGPVAAYDGGPVEGGGTVAGTVKFDGEAPEREPFEITQDPDFCGKEPILGEELLVSPDGGLANVVVYIDAIDKGKTAEPGKAMLSNTKCRYEPHVQAVLVGTKLAVVNADPVLHNTHSKGPVGNTFNLALPTQGQTIEQRMRSPGLLKIGCDAGHTWMRAWIAVLSHPYFAVTGADGSFSLDDVPPGDYTLIYWHESLGKQTKDVTVTAEGVDASVTFEE